MSVWKILEAVLREAHQYRGETDVRFSDLEKLRDAMEKKKRGSGPDLDKQGGSFSCDWPFNSTVWKGWRPDRGIALTMASTDSKRDVPTFGAPQGGTVMKRNYGGRVFYQPGNARPPANNLLGSAMDRYDVLMVGDVLGEKGRLLKVAYAPSIGSAEERRQRLEDLLAGRKPAQTRRAQADKPDLPKDDLDKPKPPAAQPVPRVGQNLRIAKVSDED